ncbi:hypothetical protein ROHU_019443 [Labeo rohita]|uniref:Uncharacterized protein n=1 Tax=Labeo rohita TaxID=84645 RepID=A0A498N5Z5_LABRO|nr:hypothetical protein ROHU_023595 [Labeo rohita]RXN28241.1 hypothetical protein ROHU_019443 [Labeo rohita]
MPVATDVLKVLETDFNKRSDEDRQQSTGGLLSKLSFLQRNPRDPPIRELNLNKEGMLQRKLPPVCIKEEALMTMSRW